MKDGPNALIDETLPVVCIATKDPSSILKSKNVSQTYKRSPRAVAASSPSKATMIKHLVEHTIQIPPGSELLLPVLEVVPLQLLAYHIAVRRGCDVDQPRNLAKSVTVE
jgi:glutamine---fructose-6-phosphate transaminase (isomerizing)